MTNNQKNELLKLIESTESPLQLSAAGKVLNILTVSPLDDNEREVFDAYLKKTESNIEILTNIEHDLYAESKREDLQQEAEREINDNVTIKHEGDE